VAYYIARFRAALARGAALALGRRRAWLSPRGVLLVVAGIVLVAGVAYGFNLLVLAQGTWANLPPGVAPSVVLGDGWLRGNPAPAKPLYPVTPLAAGSRLPPLTGPCLNGPPPDHFPPPGGLVTVVDVWAEW
jgi:hypothetical protein